MQDWQAGEGRMQIRLYRYKPHKHMGFISVLQVHVSAVYYYITIFLDPIIANALAFAMQPLSFTLLHVVQAL